MFENPANEINEIGPSALNHVIGQRGVKEQVRVALDASFQDAVKFPASLLTGGPGLGKTQLAKVIAAEMAEDCHEVLGQSIKCAADLNAVLLNAHAKSIVFIDECHELGKEFQIALYLALDQQKIFLNGGKTGRGPQSLAIEDFTLLLATTDEYALLQPLRDRMKLVLRFEFYSQAELIEITRQRCRALRWAVQEEVIPQIAQRSRGIPRLALRLVQSARRVARAEAESTVTVSHLEKACLLEGIDCLGLGPTEQSYLRILSDGSTRLNVIASRLGLPPRTIAEVSEPFLIRAGLIVKDDGKRQLTAEGREHLSKSCPVSA